MRVFSWDAGTGLRTHAKSCSLDTIHTGRITNQLAGLHGLFEMHTVLLLLSPVDEAVYHVDHSYRVGNTWNIRCDMDRMGVETERLAVGIVCKSNEYVNPMHGL